MPQRGIILMSRLNEIDEIDIAIYRLGKLKGYDLKRLKNGKWKVNGKVVSKEKLLEMMRDGEKER